MPGDDNTAKPPVPMPNTEVKCRDADGSAAYVGARVGNRQASLFTLGSKASLKHRKVLFVFMVL